MVLDKVCIECKFKVILLIFKNFQNASLFVGKTLPTITKHF